MEDAAVSKMNAAPEVLDLRSMHILARGEGGKRVSEILQIILVLGITPSVGQPGTVLRAFQSLSHLFIPKTV